MDHCIEARLDASANWIIALRLVLKPVVPTCSLASLIAQLYLCVHPLWADSY